MESRSVLFPWYERTDEVGKGFEIREFVELNVLDLATKTVLQLKSRGETRWTLFDNQNKTQTKTKAKTSETIWKMLGMAILTKLQISIESTLLV